MHGELRCGGTSPCVVPATFENKHLLRTTAPRLDTLTYAKDGSPVQPGDDIIVEAAVYNDQFTESKISVRYMRKVAFKSISRASLPQNLHTPLLVEADFDWGNSGEDPEDFMRAANLTCRFTFGDEVVVVPARLETADIGGLYHGTDGPPTHVSCPSPHGLHNRGEGKVEVSLNGVDYGGSFVFISTEPVDVFRISPLCGPKQGRNQLHLYGSGFRDEKEQVFSKFGTIAVDTLRRAAVTTEAWSEKSWLSSLQMTHADFTTFKNRETPLTDE